MTRALCLLLSCLATSGWAIAKGGTLYIKGKDTVVLSAPRAGASKVATLQPGDAVIWLGPSEKDKTFHQISFGSKKGFVLMTNLTPNKPVVELLDQEGKPVPFAFSGAGSRECPPTYQGQGNKTEAAAELIYVEELNKAKATPEAIEAKNKELRGR
jgi:hypothetical protein